MKAEFIEVEVEFEVEVKIKVERGNKNDILSLLIIV